MSYAMEVEMIRKAIELDLLTTPYVFNRQDAIDMTEAGADVIVCHMGLTTSGSIGAKTSKTLEECVPLIDSWASAARSVRKDVILLCHGGPIAMPEDASFILQNCQNIHGFYGASSMERLPTERALTEHTQRWSLRAWPTLGVAPWQARLWFHTPGLAQWIGRKRLRTAAHIPTGTQGDAPWRPPEERTQAINEVVAKILGQLR